MVGTAQMHNKLCSKRYHLGERHRQTNRPREVRQPGAIGGLARGQVLLINTTGASITAPLLDVTERSFIVFFYLFIFSDP